MAEPPFDVSAAGGGGDAFTAVEPVAPRTRMHLIAAGLTSVQAMYVEMKSIEEQKNKELARLVRRIETLEDACLAANEREKFLLAAIEKLERKVARRDQTVHMLEERLVESRSGAGALLEELERVKHQLYEANERAIRVDLDAATLDRLARESAEEHQSSMNALAEAERELLKLRSKFYAAELSDVDPSDPIESLRLAAEVFADTALKTSLVAVTTCKVTVARILTSCMGTASIDIGANCRALLEVLRLQGDTIAASCRASFFASSLAVPLIARLRAALRSPCDGNCALVVYRCFSACEAALRAGDVLHQA